MLSKFLSWLFGEKFPGWKYASAGVTVLALMLVYLSMFEIVERLEFSGLKYVAFGVTVYAFALVPCVAVAVPFGRLSNWKRKLLQRCEVHGWIMTCGVILWTIAFPSLKMSSLMLVAVFTAMVIRTGRHRELNRSVDGESSGVFVGQT